MDYSAGPASAVTPGMEALEALAELATQERTRVIGSRETQGQGQGQETANSVVGPSKASSAHDSPVMSRMDVDAGTHTRPRPDSAPSSYARPSLVPVSASPATRSSPEISRAVNAHRSPVVTRAPELITHSPPAPPIAVHEESLVVPAPSTFQPLSPPAPPSPAVDAPMDIEPDPTHLVGPGRPSDAFPNGIGERHEVHKAASPLTTPRATEPAPPAVSSVPSPVMISVPTRVAMEIDEERPTKRRRSTPPAPG